LPAIDPPNVSVSIQVHVGAEFETVFNAPDPPFRSCHDLDPKLEEFIVRVGPKSGRARQTLALVGFDLARRPGFPTKAAVLRDAISRVLQ